MDANRRSTESIEDRGGLKGFLGSTDLAALIFNSQIGTDFCQQMDANSSEAQSRKAGKQIEDRRSQMKGDFFGPQMAQISTDFLDHVVLGK